MNQNRKNYVRITQNTSSNQIFALLDAVESEDEEDIENLMNDSDTEFFTNPDESLPLREDIETAIVRDEDTVSLVPDANIHFLEEPQPSTSMEETTARNSSTSVEASTSSNNAQTATKSKLKKKSKETSIKWSSSHKPHQREHCTLEGQIKKPFEAGAKPLEVYEQVVKLDMLIEILVNESNTYAQQKGRIFTTNAEEMKAFIGINYLMGINQLPSIKMYWDADVFIGNSGIQNVSTRQRFSDILANLHFTDNMKADKDDKGNKIRPIIDHLNNAFRDIYSDEPEQSIDEHMTKFKGRSSMKQYIKKKPIKWGFKWWFRCSSKSGYLYEFDLYLGKKKESEIGLGENVVLTLSEKLKGTYCTLFFDNFFNSPTLVSRLFERQIYSIGTVQSNRKEMPPMKPDKEMKRGDIEVKKSKDVICCKWFDNRGVLLLATNVEGIGGNSTVQRRMKGSATKIPVDCPNIVKLYNKGMGGVDLMDQKAAAYRLDRKSKFRFYLRLFFDLLDVALVNAHIIYQKLGKEISLIDFKIVIANGLIGKYSNRQRSFPSSRPTKRKSFESTGPSRGVGHIVTFQATRSRCHYCKDAGRDLKVFSYCETCGLYLCCMKERNCFFMHHNDA